MTQSTHQALDGSRRIPWPEAMGKATIRARFMLAYADTDADTLPDAHAPLGTVTLVYAGSGYRWTDADGSRLVAALPVVCPILPDGTLGAPDHNIAGDDGVIIMPTEVAGLEPAGSTVTATISIANAQATFAPITFIVKPDDDINLAELVSVQSTPGVVTVVDDAIDVRAIVTAALEAKLDNRNLALNSKAIWESTSYAVTGAQKMSEPWIVGEPYTVTIKGEVNAGQQFRIWRDSGWVEFGGLTHIGNGIHRVTAKAEETYEDAKDEFRIYNFPPEGAEFASIEWIKIERGTKATDWTPAPEDMGLAVGALRTQTVAGPGMGLRHDTSVGERVFLDHPGGSTMLMGDTGWRDISSLLHEDWVPATAGGTFQIRRQDNTVTLAARLQRAPGSPPLWLGQAAPLLNTVNSSLPSGFIPLRIYAQYATLKVLSKYVGELVGNTYGDELRIRARSAPNDILWKAGDILGFQTSWNTSNSWPSTRPGTPGLN